MYKLPGAVPEKIPFGETIKMKKTLLVTSLAAAMGGATTVDADFTAMGDGNYQMVITSGCFLFGDCVVGGEGNYTDNLNSTDTDLDWAGLTGGSGIANDGLMGVIDFTLTGGNITVTSFSQDSSLGTAGGTFYLRGADITTMGGTIDAAGNMVFDPTGRVGLAADVGTTELIWNFDDTTLAVGTPSGTFDVWTTGTTTSLPKTALSTPLTKTGSVLIDSAPNERTGTLAVASNVGDDWGVGFSGIMYTEEFNVTITPNVIPVPAAVWLFGSGLLGLVGVARRRKQA